MALLTQNNMSLTHSKLVCSDTLQCNSSALVGEVFPAKQVVAPLTSSEAPLFISVLKAVFEKDLSGIKIYARGS